MKKGVPADLCIKKRVWLHWQDRNCKSFDCALARTCLADAASQSTSLCGAQEVWELAKAFVAACDKYPLLPDLGMLAGKTVRRLDPTRNVPFVDWWKDELEDAERTLVRVSRDFLQLLTFSSEDTHCYC